MTTSLDFNDLEGIAGVGEVKRQIEQAEPAMPVVPEPLPTDWSAPMIPGGLSTPEIPTDLLPGVWGNFAQAVSGSTQTPAAMSVMCCLGVLATLLQRRFEVSPDGTNYFEPLSLFVTTVSPSGTRKTAVMGAYHIPLEQWEKLQSDRFRPLIAKANAARSTAKKRIESLNQQAAKCKDPTELEAVRAEIEREDLEMAEELKPPRLFTGNTTAERAEAMLCEQSERISIHSDEPGIFRVMGGSYSGGQQNIDVYLKGHAGSTLRVDRAGRWAHVDKPAVTFNLMCQPGLLAELAGNKGFNDSGLNARFLWAVPKTNVGRRNVRERSGMPVEVSEAYAAAVNALLEGYLCEPGTTPKAKRLQLTDAARECWLDFSQYVEDRLEPGGEFAAIGDWASKLAGAALRVAGLLELARVGLSAEEVNHDSMVDAVRLAMLLIPHCMAAYGLLGADPVEADAQAILTWAKQGARSTFTQRDAKQAMRGRFPSDEKFKKAADRLIEMECVRPFNQSDKGRRPSKAFRVNPALIPHIEVLSGFS